MQLKEGDTWRIRESEELNTLIEGKDTVRYIKPQRISWVEHIERMESTKMVRVWKRRLYGRRRRGR